MTPAERQKIIETTGEGTDRDRSEADYAAFLKRAAKSRDWRPEDAQLVPEEAVEGDDE